MQIKLKFQLVVKLPGSFSGCSSTTCNGYFSFFSTMLASLTSEKHEQATRNEYCLVNGVEERVEDYVVFMKAV